MQSLPRGILEPGQSGNITTEWIFSSWLSVFFRALSKVFLYHPSPSFTKLVTRNYWTIGPSYVPSLTPNIMYPFPLLSTFVHLFVQPFLFPLEHGSFHLFPLFSFTAKEKLSLEGLEYKDGFLQAPSIRLTMWCFCPWNYEDRGHPEIQLLMQVWPFPKRKPLKVQKCTPNKLQGKKAALFFSVFSIVKLMNTVWGHVY